ncbi:MAG: TPM domain-containing protein [Symbiobacteriaceae bacterium]|nr:TPM domain-containing protein [Symbiobacteriaceae bacterium]
MRNKSPFIFLLLLILLLTSWQVAAASPVPRVKSETKVHDFAALFSAKERTELEEFAHKVIAQVKQDLVVVTTTDLKGLRTREYADDFFDYNGFGMGDDYDGALLLIDMESRIVYISTSGAAIYYYSDDIIDRLLDEIIPYLGGGDFAGGARHFLQDAASRLSREQPSTVIVTEGDPGSYGIREEVPDDGFISRYWREILGRSALSSLIITLIIMIFMVTSHKRSLAPAPSGINYMSSPIKLTQVVDRFISSHTSSSPIPRSSSSSSSSGSSTTHSSSSGRSHGGGGKGF